MESCTDEEFRKTLDYAKDKVLNLEGRQARVNHVLKIKIDRQKEMFVAVHARIAKRIGKQMALNCNPA